MENLKIGSLLAIVAISGLIVGTILGYAVAPKGRFGGLIHNIQESFDAGIAVNGTEVISSSRGISATDLTVSGDASFAGDVTVVDSASSTLVIGSNAASNNSGCLVLGDSNSTGTLVYITASGNQITATTTKPAICK